MSWDSSGAIEWLEIGGSSIGSWPALMSGTGPDGTQFQFRFDGLYPYTVPPTPEEDVGIITRVAFKRGDVLTLPEVGQRIIAECCFCGYDCAKIKFDPTEGPIHVYSFQ